jgi:sulfatase modifying factor 1
MSLSRSIPMLIAFVPLISALFLPAPFARSDQSAGAVEPIQVGLVLIPGGEFTMGKDNAGDYSPSHKVYVDSFYMDRYEVTNAQYLRFCEETEARLPEFWGMKEFRSGPDFPDYPVVGITWSDARDYAEWSGKRLPTEAEWEYAARGGLVDMNYPQGESLDSIQANYTLADLEGTTAVGSFPPNGYGLYDMAGNVWEWVADYYHEGYYKTSPARNPPGPEDGKFKVIRGGGWHSGPFCNRVYYRQALPPHWVDFAVGFRCVKNLH